MKRVLSLLALFPLCVCAAAPPSISDLSFFTGHWVGEIEDRSVEEIWSPVQNGSLIGMSREMKDGTTGFFEFLAIEAEPEGLVLRLKHYRPQLIAMEAKDAAIVFDLSSLDEKGATFTSRDRTKPTTLIYRRASQDRLEATLKRLRGGKEKVDIFHYRLVNP